MKLINFELLITLLIINIITAFMVFGYISVFVPTYQKWTIRYKTNYERRLKEKEEAEREAEIEANATVQPGNPFLDYLAQRYNVVFYGGLGCGKTMAMNLFAKYLYNRQEQIDYKNRRLYKYTKPQLLKEKEQLIEEGKLNIYSNIELEDISTGLTNRELMPYLTQQKCATENAIYAMDEIGEKFGKEQSNLQRGKNKTYEYAMAEKSVRFARQDLNIHFICTEQSQDNIWKPIRDKGFVAVHCLGVSHWLTGKGKKIKTLKNLILKIMPGIFTLNVQELLAIEFGTLNKIKSFLKMLLPAYFLQPKAYYIKKMKIDKQINYDYTKFKINYEFNGDYGYLLFDNYDLLKYNTRGHQEKYKIQFDENGDRLGAKT